ncbi:MBL fold metallo-hydrolase [Candidatus Wolfebacteria bacterium]|nr:MBL fold metallo-hydrolase [Candidatus Wolfebacteria bacterium]
MSDASREAQLTFYGAAGSVTGSSFLLEYGDTAVVIDCGLVQGERFSEEENAKPLPYEPGSVNAVLITHAHLDHIGRLPVLVRNGYRGPIISTPETLAIAKLMFEDGVEIMHHEAERTGTTPPYTSADVGEALKLWETRKYHEPFRIGGHMDVVLLDAGHILGSAMIQVTVSGTKFLFTGDLGNSPAPLLRSTEPPEDVSYLVMESVYGDRNHESVDERREKLESIIENTVRDKGVLMIPAFSIERTQVLLYEINRLVEQGKVPAVPVFLDSPLAIKVTDVYRRNQLEFNEHTKNIIASGDDIFKFPGLTFTDSVQESKAINDIPPPKIIIAGSGMSQGGRILHHEKHYLPDHNSTILFVGYQTAGSLGRKILDGAKEVTIHGERIPVHARVRSIFAYSSHKDSDHLVEFVHSTLDTVHTVFLVMGEPRTSLFLAQRLRDYLGVKAIVPERAQSFRLRV